MHSPYKLSKVISVLTIALTSVLLAKTRGLSADPDSVLESNRWVTSGEGTVAHFGALLNDRAIQAWNLSARFSLLPFGLKHFHLLRGGLDGALEVGLEPTFERFSVRHLPRNTAGFANYEGVGLVLRYYLVHFRYNSLAPWIEAGIAPGGTDLKIGKRSNETLLTGPFMNRIKGGIGRLLLHQPIFRWLRWPPGTTHLQCWFEWSQPELRLEYACKLCDWWFVVLSLNSKQDLR